MLFFLKLELKPTRLWHGPVIRLKTHSRSGAHESNQLESAWKDEEMTDLVEILIDRGCLADWDENTKNRKRAETLYAHEQWARRVLSKLKPWRKPRKRVKT